ncbi:uncharacterized protein LOC126887663 isoform X2 [Diabrotica virgifera virgifera]|nr:uncharacterized protein LOC126887663 isoform X2 [Diabrotica virgifera virgifera]
MLRERYLLKLKIIGDLDPYAIQSELDFTVKCSPSSYYYRYLHIWWSLICHSCYSKQQMKAYKSLQAHKYFTAGFVLNGVKIVNDFLISILLSER